MFTAKDITVYVPCFNAENTIDKCVEALANQSITPGHIVAVDDGSPGPLALPGIKIIRHPSNLGLAAARNTALHACRTKLIAAVDADVLAERDWLENMLATLNQYSVRDNVSGIGGRLIEYFNERLADRWRAIHMAQHLGDARVVNPRFLYGSNTLFIADDARMCGGYDVTLRTNNEDRVFSEALYAANKSLIYEPGAVCRHLRQDTCRTILRGYWQWHHAKGLQRGDFDSTAALIQRIAKVNFGIFRYRFDMDRQAGRDEFLGLDAAIAWIFCALDLDLFARRNTTPIPDIKAVLNSDYAMDNNVARALDMLLSATMPNTINAPKSMPWHAEYLSEFHRLQNESGWLRDCTMDMAGWQNILNEEIKCA